EKGFRFPGNSYLFGVEVSGIGDHDRVGVVLTPISGRGATGGRQPGHEIGIVFANQKVVEKPLEKLGEPVETTDALWAGFSAQYFTSLAMPDNGSATAWMALSDGVPVARLDVSAAGGRAQFQVFQGPKDRETLAEAGHQLDRALDFGWFWFI